jgi:hypothetical protein
MRRAGNTKLARKGLDEPTPSTPYEAGQWKQCEPVARQAFYDASMIFAGNEEGADYDCLRAACPSLFSDVPMGGLFYMYVTDTEAAGGFSTAFCRLISASPIGQRPAGRPVAPSASAKLFKGDQKG